MDLTIHRNLVDFTQRGGAEQVPGRCDWTISTRVLVDFFGDDLSGKVDTSTLFARFDHRPVDLIHADGRADASELAGAWMDEDAPSVVEVQLLFTGSFAASTGAWSIALRGYSESLDGQWTRLVTCSQN